MTTYTNYSCWHQSSAMCGLRVRGN